MGHVMMGCKCEPSPSWFDLLVRSAGEAIGPASTSPTDNWLSDSYASNFSNLWAYFAEVDSGGVASIVSRVQADNEALARVQSVTGNDSETFGVPPWKSDGVVSRMKIDAALAYDESYIKGNGKRCNLLAMLPTQDGGYWVQTIAIIPANQADYDPADGDSDRNSIYQGGDGSPVVFDSHMTGREWPLVRWIKLDTDGAIEGSARWMPKAESFGGSFDWLPTSPSSGARFTELDAIFPVDARVSDKHQVKRSPCDPAAASIDAAADLAGGVVNPVAWSDGKVAIIASPGSAAYRQATTISSTGTVAREHIIAVDEPLFEPGEPRYNFDANGLITDPHAKWLCPDNYPYALMCRQNGANVTIGHGAISSATKGTETTTIVSAPDVWAHHYSSEGSTRYLCLYETDDSGTPGVGLHYNGSLVFDGTELGIDTLGLRYKPNSASALIIGAAMFSNAGGQSPSTGGLAQFALLQGGGVTADALLFDASGTLLATETITGDATNPPFIAGCTDRYLYVGAGGACKKINRLTYAVSSADPIVRQIPGAGSLEYHVFGTINTSTGNQRQVP